MGLKAWFKLKVKQLKCDHFWKMTVQKTVREWDAPCEWGYDWHREWVCTKCGKTDVTETHRPIPPNARFVTDENGAPIKGKEREPFWSWKDKKTRD